ncbi:MAG TPA: hypothetical protein VF080_10380 [Solirubrobacteraceae bacterium]
MPQPDRAWWDDVQYLREPLERKREKEARRGLRLDARAAARAVAERHATAPVAEAEPDYIRGLHSVHELDAVPRARRFERSADRRGRFARGERDTSEHAARLDRAPEAPAAAAPAPLSAPPRRRTVEITGRTVGAPSLPRLVSIDRRRPARRAAERVGARPDRLALWAVVLGFFLIFVAVTSTSHAATRAHSAGAASSRAVHQQVFHAHTAALRAFPPAR